MAVIENNHDLEEVERLRRVRRELSDRFETFDEYWQWLVRRDRALQRRKELKKTGPRRPTNRPQQRP